MIHSCTCSADCDLVCTSAVDLEIHPLLNLPHGKIVAYRLRIGFGFETYCWREEHQDWGCLQHELAKAISDYKFMIHSSDKLRTDLLECPFSIGKIQSSDEQAGVRPFVAPDPTFPNNVPLRLEVSTKLASKACFKGSKKNGNTVVAR